MVQEKAKVEFKGIDLSIKEQRIAYWEKYHKLPGKLADYFDHFDDQSVSV